MLTVYLVCLAFGGVLLVLSLAGGDGDVGGDLDGDLDAGGDLDHGQPAHSLYEYLSFRAAVFFLAFFGLTGTLLTAMGTAGLAALVVAVLMGGVAGAGMQSALRYLRRTETGRPFDLREVEGSRARVLLGCERQRRGKIVVDVGERTLQLLALAADEAGRDSFAPGETVIVVSVRDGVAYVAGEDLVR